MSKTAAISGTGATRRTKRSGSSLLRVGFMPLVDSATLIVAQQKGFAADEGLTLDLRRETSWANIRDRLVLGHFDAAHMLGPMPIAANIGAGQFDVPLIAPMVLNLGGNAITLSRGLADAIELSPDDEFEPAIIGRKLADYLAHRRRRKAAPATFAMVYPFSTHNYELRYWLAACDIDSDRDVRLVVVPPPFMVDALAQGHIDGFCVGAPWNDIAVSSNVGHTVLTKAQLWRQSPEKVLAFRQVYANEHPEQVDALIRALVKAAVWAGDMGNRRELAAMLAEPRHVDAPAEAIERVLAGRVLTAPGGEGRVEPDYIIFDRCAAAFPWQSHALWLYSQMVRWGQVSHSEERAEISRITYRPEIFRRAVSGLGVPVPNASMKVEGALTHPTAVGSLTGELVLGPDGFFDGNLFDPDDVEGYLRRFATRSS